MKKWGRQVFLNEAWENDSGAIVAYVQLHKSSDRASAESEVTVWDCDRKVTLDFRADRHNYKERRKKIDRFEQVTQAFIQRYRAVLDQVEKAAEKE